MWNAPRTVATGDQAISGDLNTAQDTMNYFKDPLGGWHDFVLVNPWYSWGPPYAPCGYKVVAQTVYLRGIIANASANNWAPGYAWQYLPTIYAPSWSQIMSALGYIAGQYKCTKIQVDGNGLQIAAADGTAPTNSSQFVQLDGLSWDMEHY